MVFRNVQNGGSAAKPKNKLLDAPEPAAKFGVDICHRLNFYFRGGEELFSGERNGLAAVGSAVGRSGLVALPPHPTIQRVLSQEAVRYKPKSSFEKQASLTKGDRLFNRCIALPLPIPYINGGIGKRQIRLSVSETASAVTGEALGTGMLRELSVFNNSEPRFANRI